MLYFRYKSFRLIFSSNISGGSFCQKIQVAIFVTENLLCGKRVGGIQHVGDVRV